MVKVVNQDVETGMMLQNTRLPIENNGKGQWLLLQ